MNAVMFLFLLNEIYNPKQPLSRDLQLRDLFSAAIVEQDQPAHTCSLILLCTLRCSNINFFHPLKLANLKYVCVIKMGESNNILSAYTM